MVKTTESKATADKLVLELRRGVLVLATLSQLESRRYGYSLVQRLAERGLEIEQGTLYPLLRRLDAQGLLDSEWKVEGPRPRKYYKLSAEGRRVLAELAQQWRGLVEVMAGLLPQPEGE